MNQAPHTLTLSLSDDVDPDCPGMWNDAKLTCPFITPIAAMPCAVYELCGCKPLRTEMADRDGDSGAGPCDKSQTGVHSYFEGEPNRPLPRCWAVHDADDLDYAAMDLGIPCGEYLVLPYSEDGALKFELVEHGDGG